MKPRLVLLLTVPALVLAGCLSPQSETVEPQANLDLGLVADASSLWTDPQNAPHPGFNFPTLTNPAVNGTIPPYWAPIQMRELPSPIAGLQHLAATQDQTVSGAGIALFGSLAIVPGYGQTTKILDITNPESPVILSEFKGNGTHRGAVVIPYPDGRLVTVFSMASGLDIWDITNVKEPEALGTIEVASHKVGVVPGTPILYNANSKGGGSRLADQGSGKTEIYDLTDPAMPVHVQDFKNGFGCHHIYFWNSLEQNKFRAICAGIQFSQIWDTRDPLNPEVIVSVPVHHGNPALPSMDASIVAFSHFSILNDEGTILIVGDEMGGGGIPPGCAARAATPVRDVTTPLGALWFYDVQDEKNPQLLGWFSPGHHLDPGRAMVSCTAHHGRLVPDPERDLLAMGFYGAGVVLVDFTNPASPRMVDQWNEGTNTWEVWYYNGYVFTGDLNRGLDVLTLR